MLRAFLAVTLLTGCTANWGSEADAWNGQHIDDLVYAWGPPDSTQQLEDGRKVTVYSHSRLHKGTTFYCDVTYRTDMEGIITSHSITGNIGGCNGLFGSKRKPSS